MKMRIVKKIMKIHVSMIQRQNIARGNQFFLILITGLLIYFLLGMTSCRKTEPEAESIIGSWSRKQTFETGTIGIRLTFTSDHILWWEPLDPGSGHTRSEVQYMLDGNRFYITNDIQCNSEAKYGYIINDKTLTLNPLTDSCAPRRVALIGDWVAVE